MSYLKAQNCVALILVLKIVVLCCAGPLVDWSFENVSEGPCFLPSPNPAEFNTTWLGIALKADWYIPLASRMYIYARAHHQDVDITEKFLQNLCLKFKPSSPVSIIVGLTTNQTTLLGCRSDKIGEQSCLVQVNYTGVPEFGEIEGISIWTDNAKFILLSFCGVSESTLGSKTWVLLANERTISKSDKNIVLGKVEENGFNRTLAYNLDYHNCV